MSHQALIDALADALVQAHTPAEGVAAPVPEAAVVDDRLDGLASACLRQWADGPQAGTAV
jgi:hypothetical protein